MKRTLQDTAGGIPKGTREIHTPVQGGSQAKPTALQTDMGTIS